jgi:RNA polymerase sigma-70 factor, ECF subfamily
MMFRNHSDKPRREFERMYTQHRGRLFAYFVYRTGDRALAEDLVGDVFERAFRARASFDARRGTELSWLYTIAINRLRDHHRRAQFERAALEEIAAERSPLAETPLDCIPDRDRVMRALQTLNPREREAIALRYGADLTAKQISRATGLTVTTVEGRLFRALRRLASLLEADATVATDSLGPPAPRRASETDEQLAATSTSRRLVPNDAADR